MLSIALGQLVATATRALHHLCHQRLDQLTALRIRHQRRGAGPEQDGQTVVRHIPHQLLPARLGQVAHGLRVDASRAEQLGTRFDHMLTRGGIGSRAAVIPQVHRPEGLMADHARRLAIDADKTQTAQQVQMGR
ncbi:hypothetical protein D3C84_868550 [compost metagenome]